MTKEQQYVCPNCSTTFQPVKHLGVRVLAAGAGALVGGAMSRSVLLGLAAGGISYWGAGKFDQVYLQRCPDCKARTLPQPIEAGIDITPQPEQRAA